MNDLSTCQGDEFEGFQVLFVFKYLTLFLGIVTRVWLWFLRLNWDIKAIHSDVFYIFLLDKKKESNFKEIDDSPQLIGFLGTAGLLTP